MDASWARDVFAAYRTGALGADELWCVVLECFEHDRAAALAASVLRAYVPNEVSLRRDDPVGDEFIIEGPELDAPAA
ncbi:MAG: hypothetical protein H0W72_06925 [Planctomycetes bacterium]|nr:hypothetical protein [Planctomycetota bacterium]